MNIETSPASLAGVSEAEWQIRCDLAALYRLIAHHRWTDFIYTHLSARLPGTEDHFLINKYGVNFQHMRASGVDTLVECGSGKVLSGLVKRIDKEMTGLALNTPADIEAFLKTV